MEFIPTSSKALNTLMDGWIRGGINTIYGEARTGKSTLIMDAILNSYEPDNSKQVFLILDTESGFNLDRLEILAKQRKINLDDLLGPVDPETKRRVGGRVKVCSVGSFDDQHETIKIWEKEIQKNSWQPAILAVDSFVNFYHQSLCNVPPQYMGNQARIQQGRLATETVHLLSLAQRYNSAVLLVSWVKSKLGRKLKQKESDVESDIEAGFGCIEFNMIGGPRLEYMSKVLLRLYRAQRRTIAAVLLKHLNKPTDYYTWFAITSDGIEDVLDKEKNRIERIEVLLDQIRNKEAKYEGVQL